MTIRTLVFVLTILTMPIMVDAEDKSDAAGTLERVELLAVPPGAAVATMKFLEQFPFDEKILHSSLPEIPFSKADAQKVMERLDRSGAFSRSLTARADQTVLHLGTSMTRSELASQLEAYHREGKSIQSIRIRNPRLAGAGGLLAAIGAIVLIVTDERDVPRVDGFQDEVQIRSADDIVK